MCVVSRSPASCASRCHDSKLNGCGTQRIAVIRVVLDHQESTARTNQRGKAPHGSDLPVARHEVEAVRGHDPVQASDLERAVEVRDEGLEADGREADGHRPSVCTERSGVAIHRNHGGARPEQLGERERERATPGADVRPALAGSDTIETGAQQRDVVGVVHRAD